MSFSAPEAKHNQDSRRNIQSILENPVFIVGSPRSGTTWVQRMLLSHENICGGQESAFFCCFGPLLASFMSLDPMNQAARRVGMPCYWSREDIVETILELWYRTFQPVVELKVSATLMLEKTPEHALFIPQILELLPKSRFIHVIRDSRSVVASLLAANRQPWGSFWAPSRARDAANVWYSRVNAAREAAQSMGFPYLEVHYEDLRKNTSEALPRIFDFLSVNYSEAMVSRIVDEQDFDRQRQIGGTPLAAIGDPNWKKQAEPPGFFRSGKIESWKHELSFAQKLVVWKQTRKLMRKCGYGLSGRLRPL